MKILISTLIVGLLLMTGIALADVSISDNIKKIPALTTGGYYSVIDSVFNYSATFKALETKDTKFALNIGYAGQARQTCDKAIVTVSYNLLKLKDYVNVPILDLMTIEPYIVGGYGRVNLQALTNSEFDLGVGVNILKVSW